MTLPVELEPMFWYNEYNKDKEAIHMDIANFEASVAANSGNLEELRVLLGTPLTKEESDIIVALRDPSKKQNLISVKECSSHG